MFSMRVLFNKTEETFQAKPDGNKSVTEFINKLHTRSSLELKELTHIQKLRLCLRKEKWDTQQILTAGKLKSNSWASTRIHMYIKQTDFYDYIHTHINTQNTYLYTDNHIYMFTEMHIELYTSTPYTHHTYIHWYVVLNSMWPNSMFFNQMKMVIKTEDDDSGSHKSTQEHKRSSSRNGCDIRILSKLHNINHVYPT